MDNVTQHNIREERGSGMPNRFACFKQIDAKRMKYLNSKPRELFVDMKNCFGDRIRSKRGFAVIYFRGR